MGEGGMPVGGNTPVGLTFDDLPDGVLVADAGGTVVVFNRAAERITGLARVDVLGVPLPAALPLTDNDGRRWWECVDPYSGLAIRTGHAERTLTLPGGDDVLVTSAFVRDQRLGDVRAVVVGLRDTHARARDERSRAELISTVAHELRSPLTSVKGFTATLLAKWERFTDAQKRLMLETVNADADRVTRLITELLDIARIDSGRLTVRLQMVDLVAMVHRQVAGLVAGGHAADRFVVEAPGDLPEVWADADKVDQVLANLLENAVGHGAGTVTVRIEAAGDGHESVGRPGTKGHVAVTVMDGGEGVAEDLRVRVFTKFWRSGHPGGTGLGLYIVRGLVEAHGGTVTLGSAPGGGALFRFTLPAGTPDFAR